MNREAPSVAVGPYLLEVGGEAGTLVEQGGNGETESESLRAAFEEPEPKAEERAPALASEIDEAAETTTKIEQAVALCKGAAEGHALDPDQLALEVGTLLDCLERLDRKKEHKKALQLARSLSTLLMLLKRWASLIQTLRTALRAGRALGDDSAVAWAEHELGTLRLAAGDVEGADRSLQKAREIREKIGDRRGLAATERNMQALCDRLRSMLRNDELVRNRPRRISRLLSLAGLFLVLVGGGVAAGVMVSGDPVPGGGSGAVTESKVGDAAEVHTDTHPDGDGVTDETTRFALVVSIAGDGHGSVKGGGIDCPEGTCKVEVLADETVTLTAQPDAKYHLDSFSDDCSGTSCTLVMTGPMSVTATFSRGPEPEITTEPESTTEDDEGGLQEEEEEEEETTSAEIIE
jgi:hypothetical protein